MLVEPAMTNKLTCMKSNPTSTTNITQIGDAAAVLSVVNDIDALTAAGLHKICLGNVYKLDNSAGTTIASGVIVGPTVNTNAHSISVHARASAGSGSIKLNADLAVEFSNSSYERLKADNITPTSSRQMWVTANAGAVIYFILPQLEESPFCTSIIAPAADTAASQTRAASVVSASTSGVFPSTGQDFAVFLERVTTAAGQTATLLSTRVDADNLFYVAATATMVGAVLRKTATDNAASAFYTHAAATKFQTIAIKTAMGMAVKCREYSGGVWGAWTAWGVLETAGAKATSPIGTTYQIGAANSLNQFTGNYPETAIIAMPPKATLAEYQAWIEAELTLRGLI
jgi:hypothetical protein